MVWLAVDRRVSSSHEYRPPLIRAAADHAAGHAVAPPPDLIKLWDWQDLSTPPVAGGLDDQPAGLLRRARYLEAVHDIMRRWYRDGSKDFTPSEREVFDLVLKIRKETHASQ